MQPDPEWEQPGSTNGYSKGDKVTHNGKTWESLVDRRSDDCSGKDHCDPVCTSGSDHTWNFRIYEKEGLDSPGRHETGAVGRKWITEIGKILLQ